MEQLEMFDKPDQPEGMLDGIKVMLARMDSNPEEFSLSEGPWIFLLNTLLQNEEKHFTEEEVSAVRVKMRDVNRQNFSSAVLKRLMHVENPQSVEGIDISKYLAKPSRGQIAGSAKLFKDLSSTMSKSFESTYKESFGLAPVKKEGGPQ